MRNQNILVAIRSLGAKRGGGKEEKRDPPPFLLPPYPLPLATPATQATLSSPESLDIVKTCGSTRGIPVPLYRQVLCT